MPGFAAIVGCAKSNEVAVGWCAKLQRRNILTFLSGNVNGRSIIHQLQEEGVEMGYDTYIVPLAPTRSAPSMPWALPRSALTFGGMKGGQARDILMYNKNRLRPSSWRWARSTTSNARMAAGAINSASGHRRHRHPRDPAHRRDHL